MTTADGVIEITEWTVTFGQCSQNVTRAGSAYVVRRHAYSWTRWKAQVYELKSGRSIVRRFDDLEPAIEFATLLARTDAAFRQAQADLDDLTGSMNVG